MRIKDGEICPVCCKGVVETHMTGDDGWETVCDMCGALFDED